MLGISIHPRTQSEILAIVDKAMTEKKTLIHIVSLNAENMVGAQTNRAFARVLNEAQIQIADGVGMQWASKWLREPVGDRITGVDLMSQLVSHLGEQSRSVRIVFLGGRGNVASTVATHYQSQYPSLTCIAIPDVDSTDHAVIDTVVAARPDMVFVAFGSPRQELWVDAHKDKLNGTLCMGVGGGFDFVAGAIPRAPTWMRNLGLEWLYRLVKQPWRWKRQMKIFTFVRLVLLSK